MRFGVFSCHFQTLNFKKNVLDACSRKLSIKRDVLNHRKDREVVASCEITNVTLYCTTCF